MGQRWRVGAIAIILGSTACANSSAGAPVQPEPTSSADTQPSEPGDFSDIIVGRWLGDCTGFPGYGANLTTVTAEFAPSAESQTSEGVTFRSGSAVLDVRDSAQPGNYFLSGGAIPRIRIVLGSGSWIMDADLLVAENELTLTNLVSATGSDSTTYSCALQREGTESEPVSSPLVGTWNVGVDCAARGISDRRTLTFTAAGELYLDDEVESYSIIDSQYFRRTAQDGTTSLYYFDVTDDTLSMANADPYGNPCVLTRSDS